MEEEEESLLVSRHHLCEEWDLDLDLDLDLQQQQQEVASQRHLPPFSPMNHLHQ